DLLRRPDQEGHPGQGAARPSSGRLFVPWWSGKHLESRRRLRACGTGTDQCLSPSATLSLSASVPRKPTSLAEIALDPIGCLGGDASDVRVGIVPNKGLKRRQRRGRDRTKPCQRFDGLEAHSVTGVLEIANQGRHHVLGRTEIRRDRKNGL